MPLFSSARCWQSAPGVRRSSRRWCGERVRETDQSFNTFNHEGHEVARETPRKPMLLPQGQRSQDGLLFGDERLNALAGQADHFSELFLIEDLMLGGGLNFDQLAPGGHDEVHVHVGA